MFPERSEGDAKAGSPPEETTVDASQASQAVEGTESTSDSVVETAIEASSDDADTSAADDASGADESPGADAVEETEVTEEPESELSEAEDSDEEADEPTEEVAASEAEEAEAEDAAAAATEPAEAIVEAADHSDDPHHWDGPSVPFVPHHALLEGMMALAFLTFGLIFVSMIPAPLEARANPYLSPEGVLPEWYLMAPFELLHLVPPLPGMLSVGAAVGVLMMWPFIDRHPRRITRRPFVLGLSFLIIAAILALSIIPYVHTGE